MSISRIIIFGEPLVGKQKLMQYLRHALPELPAKEMDEELAWANGGTWPEGVDYRNDNLVPFVVDQLLNSTDIIFFASYLPEDHLGRLKASGFQVGILEISRAEWIKRDHSRFARTHHSEMAAWTLGHPDFIDNLERSHGFDFYIDGEMTPDKIAAEIEDLRRANLGRRA